MKAKTRGVYCPECLCLAMAVVLHEHPDYLPGSLCNACGDFVLNGEWEWPDDDESED